MNTHLNMCPIILGSNEIYFGNEINHKVSVIAIFTNSFGLQSKKLLGNLRNFLESITKISKTIKIKLNLKNQQKYVFVAKTNKNWSSESF